MIKVPPFYISYHHCNKQFIWIVPVERGTVRYDGGIWITNYGMYKRLRANRRRRRQRSGIEKGYEWTWNNMKMFDDRVERKRRRSKRG